jgi:hypothetical protein
LEAYPTFHKDREESHVPSESVQLGHEQYCPLLLGPRNGRLQLRPVIFLPTLDFEEGGHQLRIAKEKILHGGLLGFEAGLTLADGTYPEIGDKLGHWYKTTPLFPFVTKVKRTANTC